MPKDKFVEARNQTEHKLELMDRYWGAWCTILAQTLGRYPFCPTHLWLIDTHAGSGVHESSTDPDGEIPGTPLQAAHAALTTQRRFAGVVVHVRASDIRPALAAQLATVLSPWRGDPPKLLDLVVSPEDWVTRVPEIVAEIASDDHPHGGQVGSSKHDHRSLWLIDPFGLDGIDHMTILTLPAGAEVIINLDLMTAIRFIARARQGEEAIIAILDRAFGGRAWDAVGEGAQSRGQIARVFAESFRGRWSIRNFHLLRQTGSQDRAMVHLTDAKAADQAFTKAFEASLKVGTVIAGPTMTKQEKDRAADDLLERFRGLSVTTRQMYAATPRWSLQQLRWICSTAQDRGLGRWDERSSEMTWFIEPRPPAGLWGD